MYFGFLFSYLFKQIQRFRCDSNLEKIQNNHLDLLGVSTCDQKRHTWCSCADDDTNKCVCCTIKTQQVVQIRMILEYQQITFSILKISCILLLSQHGVVNLTIQNIRSDSHNSEHSKRSSRFCCQRFERAQIKMRTSASAVQNRRNKL